MTLAIFDLDNTLIGGDSDNLWGQFLCENGLVESDDFALRNEQFYRDYQQGNLDVDAYLRFALQPLANQPMETLDSWHRDFMKSKIEPIVLPRAIALIERHRAMDHRLLIVTATNEFITRPIADRLNIEDMLACEAEIVDGQYTGKPIGVPSYHDGKVTRLKSWLAQRGGDMEGAYFYSDSHSDLPLLEIVDNPVAVDPDDKLRDRANEKSWPIISLR